MIANLQILRCVAALAVVWHHLQIRMDITMDWRALEFIGRAGVDIFFVISGFIMFHTTQAGDRTMVQFWRDRIIRIAPMYWLVTGLVLILFLSGLRPLEVRAVSVVDVVTDLAFLPNHRVDGASYPILDVGWTLIYEMYFYGLFGLTFLLRSQIAALAALTAFFVAAAALRVLTPVPHPFDFYFQAITLEFVAGGALALLYRRASLLPRSAARLIGWMLAGGGVVLLAVTAGVYGEYVNWNWELRLFAFGGPATLIVAGSLLLERAGMVPRHQLLLLLGAASYSIYLIHPVVVQYGIELFNYVLPSRGLVEAITIGVMTFGLSIFAGVALHLFLERPLTRILNGAVRKRQKPDALPAGSAA